MELQLILIWKAIASQENQLKYVRIKKWTVLFLCIVWTLLMNCVIDVLIKLSVQWWQERRSGEMRKKRQILLLQAHHNCQKNTRRDSACSETLFCAWVGWQLIVLERSLGTQERKRIWICKYFNHLTLLIQINNLILCIHIYGTI